MTCRDCFVVQSAKAALEKKASAKLAAATPYRIRVCFMLVDIRSILMCDMLLFLLWLDL